MIKIVPLKKLWNRLWVSFVSYTAVWGGFQLGGITWKSQLYWYVLVILLAIIIYWHVVAEVVGFFRELKADILFIRNNVGETK